MKTRHITILAATALALAALALAGCDRTIDDIDPAPISEGATGPQTAFHTMGGVAPIIEVPEDTTTGGDVDTVIEGDLPDVGDTEFEINECIGSETYCECLAIKDNDEEKYGEYCDCMDAAQVPSWDNEHYCGCCFFAFDPSYPEFDGEGNGDDKPWGLLATTYCIDIEPASCNWD